MSLDPTAKMTNVWDSLKKFFVDNLYTTEKLHLTFDRTLTTPKIQGHEVEKWVVITPGPAEREAMGYFTLEIFCCTRQDPEEFKLVRLSDKVMGYLTDTTATHGMKSIPLYQSSSSGAWTLIGALLVQDIVESGNLDASDLTKYKILTVTLRWSAKI